MRSRVYAAAPGFAKVMQPSGPRDDEAVFYRAESVVHETGPIEQLRIDAGQPPRLRFEIVATNRRSAPVPTLVVSTH